MDAGVPLAACPWRRRQAEPLGALLLEVRIPAPIAVMQHIRMSTVLTRLRHGAIQPMNRLPTAAATPWFPQVHGACTSCPVVDDL
jgi:hypothetical protein